MLNEEEGLIIHLSLSLFLRFQQRSLRSEKQESALAYPRFPDFQVGKKGERERERTTICMWKGKKNPRSCSAKNGDETHCAISIEEEEEEEEEEEFQKLSSQITNVVSRAAGL